MLSAVRESYRAATASPNRCPEPHPSASDELVLLLLHIGPGRSEICCPFRADFEKQIFRIHRKWIKLELP